MAKISAKKRRSLPRSSFVYPKQRRYPIHDKAHARSALQMGARSDTFGSIKTIKAKVYKRYPSLRPTKGKKK